MWSSSRGRSSASGARWPWCASLVGHWFCGLTPRICKHAPGAKSRCSPRVPRLKIRGGFGRNGTGCREFRHLARACDETLLLVDLPLEEAGDAVADCIAEIRADNNAAPAEREGLAGWVEDWQQQHSASPRVAKVIVDAMAHYLAHLRATGTSPRTLTGVCSDLNAAGHLVLMYGDRRSNRVLEHFAETPHSFEFERKFTDRPALVARYHRNLEGFAGFLRERGELPNEDG